MDSTIAPAHLNNKGVFLAQESDSNCLDAAVDLFSQALNVCKKILIELENGRPIPSKVIDINNDMSMTSFQESMEIAETIDILVEDSPSCRRYMFSRLILVPTRSSFSHAEYIQLSFAILFNLAVTTHMKAERDANNDELRKALTLYELSYNLSSSSAVSVSACHAMALVNNIGILHEAIGQEKQAQQCFDHLLATCMLLLVTGQAEMSHLQDFFANTYHRILAERAAPAA